MRSYLVALIIFGSIPFIIKMPHIGLYVYAWISYMNPHRLTWGFAYDFQFAMLIGVITFCAWLISKEPKKLPINTGTVLILAFAIWITVTTAFAIRFDISFEYWQQAVKILSIPLLTIIIINERKRVDWLVWVIVVSIGYFAVKGGIFTVLSGGSYHVLGPPQSNIRENNALGLATVMILPLARYLHLQATNRWIRLGLLGSIPVMFFSILGSQSRGALLAVGAMVMFLWLKSRHKLATGLGMLVLVAVGFTFMPESWTERMQTIKTYEEDESAMRRLETWAFALRFVADHPITGGGFRVFEIEHLRPVYAPDFGHVDNAHNMYIEVLGMHGFPGLFLFLAIILTSFASGSWTIRQVKIRPERTELVWARDLAAMGQVGLIGFAVGGTFLNLAFFDVFWHLIVLLIVVRMIVARELAAPSRAMEAPLPQDSAPAPAPAAGHRSFVRSGADARSSGFVRRSG